MILVPELLNTIFKFLGINTVIRLHLVFKMYLSPKYLLKYIVHKANISKYCDWCKNKLDVVSKKRVCSTCDKIICYKCCEECTQSYGACRERKCGCVVCFRCINSHKVETYKSYYEGYDNVIYYCAKCNNDEYIDPPDSFYDDDNYPYVS